MTKSFYGACPRDSASAGFYGVDKLFYFLNIRKRISNQPIRLLLRSSTLRNERYSSDSNEVDLFELIEFIESEILWIEWSEDFSESERPERSEWSELQTFVPRAQSRGSRRPEWNRRIKGRHCLQPNN